MIDLLLWVLGIVVVIYVLIVLFQSKTVELDDDEDWRGR